MDFIQIARMIFILGMVLIILAGAIYLSTKLGISLGNLPGDFRIKNSEMTCVFALGTSIFLSIILTIMVNLLARFLK
jgi:biotin transporter BioY